MVYLLLNGNPIFLYSSKLNKAILLTENMWFAVITWAELRELLMGGDKDVM